MRYQRGGKPHSLMVPI